jgi:hypothetical protein
MEGHMSNIISDSSIYTFPEYSNATNHINNTIVIGTIVSRNNAGGLPLYLVKTINSGNFGLVRCTTLVNFGGIFNFEEKIYNGMDNTTTSGVDPVAPEAGDQVLVGFIGGNTTYGVILGCMPHPGRTPELDGKESGYRQVYNGFTIDINKDGEGKLLFNGIPTNSSSTGGLGKMAEKAEYDAEVGGSNILWQKDGSILISEGKDISIMLDKPNGKISICSGENKVEIEKESGKMTIGAKDISTTVENDIKTKAKLYSVEASGDVKIKGSKVAIGTSGGELLDMLVKLIDALGTIVLANGGGACHPIQAAPTWAQVLTIKSTIESMKGSL